MPMVQTLPRSIGAFLCSFKNAHEKIRPDQNAICCRVWLAQFMKRLRRPKKVHDPDSTRSSNEKTPVNQKKLLKLAHDKVSSSSMGSRRWLVYVAERVSSFFPELVRLWC